MLNNIFIYSQFYIFFIKLRSLFKVKDLYPQITLSTQN